MVRITSISEETRVKWRAQGLIKICCNCFEEYRPVQSKGSQAFAKTRFCSPSCRRWLSRTL